ncbi:VOC family protein [Sediminibacillus massiliensis]|uniref:VOC family protein n=1 Tax=Sediminibacillus massiliensis TaxID=1926277 RepID=UPI0009888A5C|nr:VOC family protein [Sediminibacillus massiliensis]
MIERIDTICMQVENVEKASTWYEEKLGFQLSFIGEGYRVLNVGDSPVPLTIEEAGASRKENSSYPIFFVPEIEKAYQDLQNKGVQVSKLHKDKDNCYFDCYDLDNNRLQFCFWE